MTALYTLAAVVFLTQITRAIWRMVTRPAVTGALLSGVTFVLVSMNDGHQTLTALSGIGALILVSRMARYRGKGR